LFVSIGDESYLFVSIGDEFIYDRPESPMIPLDQIMLLYEFLIADSC